MIKYENGKFVEMTEDEIAAIRENEEHHTIKTSTLEERLEKVEKFANSIRELFNIKG